MDYASEQQMELEALEAIFMDDMKVYNGSVPATWAPVGNTYIMTITLHEEGEEDAGGDQDLEMEMLFAHTEQYPEQPPCLKLQSVYGLTDTEVAQCTAMLEEQIQQNLGMAMIYTLITAAKEWLRNRASVGAEEDPEEAAKRAAAEEEAKRQAARAHGTPVTLESFMAWKKAFDAEIAEAKAKAAAEAASKDDEKAKRMSGKQWFMQDRTEASTEAGALSEDDEEDFGDEDNEQEELDEEDFGDEDDIDYEDDDDEGMLDELDETG